MQLDPATIFAGMTATAALLGGGAKAVAEYRRWRREPPASRRPRKTKPRSRS